MVYTRPAFWVMVVGVFIIALSLFIPAPIDLFKLGTGICFASFLVPAAPLRA